MVDPELKKLPLKERIKKLKEIEKKHKEEIKEAQELIKKSEEEEKIIEGIKDVPIPQIKSDTIDELFGEAKEIFKEARFKSDNGLDKKEDSEKSTSKDNKSQSRLEDEISQEKEFKEKFMNFGEGQVDYINKLSKAPAQELQTKVKDIYENVKEKGYMSNSEQEELNNIHYATQKKMYDIEQGRYKDVNKQVAEEMITTEKMKNWLSNKYLSN